MKKITKASQIDLDESYLIFIGYHYSPSGFGIGVLNLANCFEMQGNGEQYPFTDDLIVFTLPKV